MENFHLFEFLPLWVTFVGIVLIVVFSMWLGVYVARKRKQPEEESPIGTVVSATLGLLAFILAFTFGLTASRFDARKQFLLEEVTAIETTTVRADLIPEPHRSAVRDLMRKYVELRIQPVGSNQSVPELIRQSEELQRQLWSHAAALAESDLKNADIVSLFVDSVNEMINMQTRRVTIAYYRIPPLIWLVHFGVTIISMILVGYLFGRSGNINRLFVVALALAFAGVMILIVDLDRSGSGAAGVIQVSQKPMIDLHERLYRTPAEGK